MRRDNIKTQRYYRLSKEDCGKECVFTPRIPKDRMTGEDSTTPRICVSQSILGCMEAIDNPYTNCSKMYLYVCDVPASCITQPSRKQVPDSAITGELWLTKKTVFKKEAVLHIEKKPLDDEYSLFIVEDKKSRYKMQFTAFDGKRVIAEKVVNYAKKGNAHEK